MLIMSFRRSTDKIGTTEKSLNLVQGRFLPPVEMTILESLVLQSFVINLFDICPDGGIGRHARFRV